jgi:hypothetical protein
MARSIALRLLSSWLLAKKARKVNDNTGIVHILNRGRQHEGETEENNSNQNIHQRNNSTTAFQALISSFIVLSSLSYFGAIFPHVLSGRGN